MSSPVGLSGVRTTIGIESADVFLDDERVSTDVFIQLSAAVVIALTIVELLLYFSSSKQLFSLFV